MQTRFYEHKGITFGYTTPISIGNKISCSIIEIPSKPYSDWPNLPKYNNGELIKNHIKEVVPLVIQLLEKEIKTLELMNDGKKITYIWFYFDLNKQGHLI